MKIIKRKIVLNGLNSDVHLKIPLYQNIDNMGLRSDIVYYGNEITESIEKYFKQGGVIISISNSKLNRLKSYDNNEEFKLGFDINKEIYSNYKKKIIEGVNRVTTIDGNRVVYVTDAERNSKIGTKGQTTGILYEDNPIDGVIIPDELDVDKSNTIIQYISEGWNETNTSLTPQIQEEYLLGVISEPEVENDVFIDRGNVSVLDRHLKLSEIKSLDQLTKYGNGFFNINRD